MALCDEERLSGALDGWGARVWLLREPGATATVFQLVPAVGGGVGLGAGVGAGGGAGAVKQPLLCHCMSRTRRTDWI